MDQRIRPTLESLVECAIRWVVQAPFVCLEMIVYLAHAKSGILIRAKCKILILHPPASPSEGILLATSVNFLLSITSGMTTLMFQQVSFDGFQTKLSLKAALTLETMEGYGVQPR